MKGEEKGKKGREGRKKGREGGKEGKEGGEEERREGEEYLVTLHGSLRCSGRKIHKQLYNLRTERSDSIPLVLVSTRTRAALFCSKAN